MKTTQTFDRISAQLDDARRILEIDPTNVSALKKIGYCEWIQGDFEAVERTATRILRMNPADADWLYSRAMARLAMRNLEGSSADLQKALAISVDQKLTATILDALQTIRAAQATVITPTHAVVELDAA